MEENSNKFDFLVITANIGSLFEENATQLRKNWLGEFKKVVLKYNPIFIALHLQEVGGKADEMSLSAVNLFLNELYEILEDFDTVRNFIDQDYSGERYTAMGCSYFIHKSFNKAEIYNFTDNSYCTLDHNKEISNMSTSPFIRKDKFPMSCFSKKTKRWPRKGFTWTKWRFLKKTYDFVNIHSPHDACNVTASLKSNTKYAKYRKKTLTYAVDRLKAEPADHQILFGDFNVRLDTKAIVEKITSNKSERHYINDENNGPKQLKYTSLNAGREDILRIEARRFEPKNYDIFQKENIPDVLQFDKELNWCIEECGYREFDIRFQPTYPHKEDPDDTSGVTFANVRCPGWCDRVLVDSQLYRLIEKTDKGVRYNIFGDNVVMGDHKPVYLSFQLVV